jgi:predicted O-methyltransferase YrrM
MAPDDPEVRSIHAEVVTADVGAWYFSMVRDEGRNAAYDRVLRRALRGGGRVLDIGAGAGLFAMMAARAGADEVISCERRPAVAAGARAVIGRNGLADRIKVIAKASTELEIGVDMAGLADLLIWDNLANNLIGVGALPAIEDAKRRLLRPGAKLIPAKAAILAALCEDRKLPSRRMAVVDGFDLSPFNMLAKPAYTIPTTSEGLEIRSPAARLFEFDFGNQDFIGPALASEPVVARGGRVNGIVQWLEFTLDEFDTYETRPGMAAPAFGVEFHPLGEPFEAPAGALFTILGSHDRERLHIRLGDR